MNTQIQDISKTKKISGLIGGGLIGIAIYGTLGVFLVVAGILLSLTIIGAIIGLPMIFYGFVMMLFGPLAGIGFLSKKNLK
jgi:hypothetical protein